MKAVFLYVWIAFLICLILVLVYVAIRLGCKTFNWLQDSKKYANSSEEIGALVVILFVFFAIFMVICYLGACALSYL